MRAQAPCGGDSIGQLTSITGSLKCACMYWMVSLTLGFISLNRIDARPRGATGTSTRYYMPICTCMRLPISGNVLLKKYIWPDRSVRTVLECLIGHYIFSIERNNV